MNRPCWYKVDGKIIAYISDDRKWFNSTSGVPKFYIDGKWIFSKEGDAVGILDEQREWIFSPKGEPLGYLFPKLHAD